MDAKLVDTGTLTGARHTADTDAHTIASEWEALLYHLLRHRLVLGACALQQSDSTAEDGDIAAAYALHKVCHTKLALSRARACF